MFYMFPLTWVEASSYRSSCDCRSGRHQAARTFSTIQNTGHKASRYGLLGGHVDNAARKGVNGRGERS